MWLFVDESWPPDDYKPKFGVLLGVLVCHEQLATLDRFLFATRKKYYGSSNAKNPHSELKGKDLLSNYTLRLWRKKRTLPNNLCILRELLSYPVRQDSFYLKVFASTVFSTHGSRPELLAPDPKRLSEPFRRLIDSAAAACREFDRKRTVTLVFDQRLGAQRDLAIAVARYVGGLDLNVHPYPYFAVSTASPGVQVADVLAHLLSKRIQKPREMRSLYRDLMKLQWISSSKPRRYGFVRLNENATASGNLSYTIRKTWSG